jgi:hypothetical protein
MQEGVDTQSLGADIAREQEGHRPILYSRDSVKPLNEEVGMLIPTENLPSLVRAYCSQQHLCLL